MPYTILSIEGNIGSGKSTLLENLRKYYSNNEQVIFLNEPVDDWAKIKDKDGTTILEKFYMDQEKYSFTFQMMAYISRLKILRNVIKKFKEDKKHYIIITERCLNTDKYVFAKMLYDQGKIEEVCYQIYLNWFNEFAEEFPINYSVYVKTDPIKCYDRIKKRERNGEDAIPLDYLKDCHDYHEEFLEEIKIKNKLVLDGNVNIYDDTTITEKWLEKINMLVTQKN